MSPMCPEYRVTYLSGRTQASWQPKVQLVTSGSRGLGGSCGPPSGYTDRSVPQGRTYLKNVTERTLVWYGVAFKSYVALVPGAASSLPTKATMQQFVVALRERGTKPVTDFA